jgi:cysteine rich repeat protein
LFATDRGRPSSVFEDKFRYPENHSLIAVCDEGPIADGDIGMSFPRLFALIALVAAPNTALAQGGPMHGACKTDIQTLCGSVQPGGGRIRECMRQHRAGLSTTCKLAIADRMLERAAHRAPAGAPGAGVTQVPGK